LDRCPVCGRELPVGTWTCPVCGEPAAANAETPAREAEGGPMAEGRDVSDPGWSETDEGANLSALAAPPRSAPLFAQDPPPPLPSGNEPRHLAEARELGWNWGGFFLPYFWLIGHGRVTLGFLLTLSACVPFLWLAHLIFYPAAAFYLGLNGYEMAWREQPYHSIGQLRDRERIWTLWGAALSVMLLAGFVLALAYLRFLGSELYDVIDAL
jgi:hypothetical protein